MLLELAPELQILINQFQRLLVISWQHYFFTQLIWKVCSFDGFHVEIALALVFFNCCISTVTEGTTVSIAHTSKIVFIPAEFLGNCLGLERAVSVVDNIPNNVVLNHNTIESCVKAYIYLFDFNY